MVFMFRTCEKIWYTVNLGELYSKYGMVWNHIQSIFGVQVCKAKSIAFEKKNRFFCPRSKEIKEPPIWMDGLDGFNPRIFYIWLVVWNIFYFPIYWE